MIPGGRDSNDEDDTARAVFCVVSTIKIVDSILCYPPTNPSRPSGPYPFLFFGSLNEGPGVTACC